MGRDGWFRSRWVNFVGFFFVDFGCWQRSILMDYDGVAEFMLGCNGGWTMVNGLRWLI